MALDPAELALLQNASDKVDTLLTDLTDFRARSEEYFLLMKSVALKVDELWKMHGLKYEAPVTITREHKTAQNIDLEITGDWQNDAVLTRVDDTHVHWDDGGTSWDDITTIWPD